MTTMRLALVLALSGLGRATATARFQLPETLEELGQYIEILLNPLYAHNPVCSNASEPFLLRYDTNETSNEVYPVCLSEDELFARRADMSICNTKVTLGPQVRGGCSQHNFLERTDRGEVQLLSSFDDLGDRDDIIAVPIHRNVPYYHGNRDKSPNFPTQMYYEEAEYLPCKMSEAKSTGQKTEDTSAFEQGYCDVEDVVKENLCWTGVGQESSQEHMLDGTGFSTPEPCDVMQHLENKDFHGYRDVSIYNTPKTFSSAKKTKVQLKIDEAQREAAKQACKFDRVVKLWELANESWYTGDGGIPSPSSDYWYGYTAGSENRSEIGAFQSKMSTNANGLDTGQDRCKYDSTGCFDMKNGKCTSDSEDCSVYNVKQYSSKNTDKCFHKKITRQWGLGGEAGSFTATYDKPETKDWRHSEKYYTFTPSKSNFGGPNACSTSESDGACVSECYDRCKGMKFPAFSVSGTQGSFECMCSDYSHNTCPNWKVNSTRKSYTISPVCGDNTDCIAKARYSDELRPCDFSADYRKHKCMETCAGKNALFMTITESGVCLCSKKQKGSSNADIGFKTNDVCPWSTATRVHTDRVGKLNKKGYEGNSFVTTEDIFTYQLKYNSYYEDERTPTDGIIICEHGNPVTELKNWYNRLTGSALDETVTLRELKQLYEKFS